MAGRKKLKVSQRCKTKTIRFYPWSIKEIKRLSKENKQTFAEFVRVVVESYLGSVATKIIEESTPAKEVVN